MATKTISLTEEAYERLKEAKKEGESFSDVVNRITPGVQLSEYYGVLGEGGSDELKRIVEERRAERDTEHEERVRTITERFDTGEM